MRNNRIGALFIISAFILAGVGGSYAMWTETITMNGIINTGNLDIAWSIYQLGDSEASGKDFSHVEAALSTDGNTLTVTVVNGYQCIDYWLVFDIHNTGTIAAHFPNGFDITYGTDFKPQWITSLGPYDGYTPIKQLQLHPNDFWYGMINIHLDNTALQNAQYTFTVTVQGVQYNECDQTTPGKIIDLPPYPDTIINAVFQNPGPNSYWQTTLSNVPGGYDVTNGPYLGWCVDLDSWIYPGNVYTVSLLSSDDPLNPWPGNHAPATYDWPCVNYIINHKTPPGYSTPASPAQIQDAIWYFIDHGYSGGDAKTQALISDALANGQAFVPQSGDVVAVLVIGIPNVQYNLPTQKTFIEVDP
ncbi:MAG: hypothetical protein IMZ43_06805 [Thermoplasmata archaeon]|nr:hypothetical protein [Thermoplasmata archaeon]